MIHVHRAGTGLPKAGRGRVLVDAIPTAWLRQTVPPEEGRRRPLAQASGTTMVSLPVNNGDAHHEDAGCGTHCGAGLEKIYPASAVRYGAMNWIGEFTYRPGSVFKCGGKVVIETDRGIELGEQVSLSCNGCGRSVSREQIKLFIDNSGPEFYKLRAGRILRAATPQDIIEHERLNADLRADIDRCALLAAQLGLEMKVVTVEHLLGGERIVFYFRSEQRIDFRELVRELARYYQTRIEMRQVGARDEARLVADYEICGRECCCKNFLKKLRPVSMKMAKLQKSTLDPAKVSGRCGRLRCCLRYEHEGYEELARKLPRAGSHVETAYGVSQVIDRQILTQLVLVRTPDGREVVIPVEEIRAFDVATPMPAERQAATPLAPPPRSERPAPPPARRPAGEPEPRDERPREPEPPIEWSEPDRLTERAPAPEAAPEEPPAPSPHAAASPADQRTNGPPAAAEPGQPGPEGAPHRKRRRRRRRGRPNRPDAPPQAPPPPGA